MRPTLVTDAAAGVPALLADERRIVDRALEHFLGTLHDCPPELRDAMRHPLFAGGKRLRPILVRAAADVAGLGADAALPAACATELVHTYSLVHDDLPAMDDSPTRRGLPTCHVLYGEAAAVLAGDALQAFAFEVLARNADVPGVDPARVVRATAELARGIGAEGMTGGQMLDLLAAGDGRAYRDLVPEGGDGGASRRVVPRQRDSRPVPEALRRIHRMKTGALLCACLRIGALIGGAGDADAEALGLYGAHLGLAFQIVDDILDVAGDEATLGKSVGADAAHAKITFPLVYGLAASRQLAEDATAQAIAALDRFGGRGQRLRDLAVFLLARDH
jgi:geranylgeranyl diphosphate synthase, type II